MTELQKVRNQTGYVLIGFGVIVVCLTFLSWAIVNSWFNLEGTAAIVASIGLTLVATTGLALALEALIARPLLYLSRFISHIASDKPLDDNAIPDHRFGHDLVKESIKTLTGFVQRVEQSTTITTARAQVATDAFERLNQPFIAVNNQQRIIASNNAARQLLGRDTLSGELLHEVLPITVDHESFLSPWINDCQETVVSADCSWLDSRFTNRDRQEYVFETHASFTRNEDNGLETVLLLIDVTDQHQADELKVDFAAMAAHELRSPITVIRGYLDVFETKLRDKFEPEEQAYIDKLKVSADQLNGFISNTLNVSRLDKGELTLHPEAHDWQPIVEETASNLQLRAEIYGKQLTLAMPDELPQVMVDPSRIAEVITNFVDNAIKYSKTSNQIAIEVSVDSSGWVQTTVTDTGIGIPANLVGKLFTKYYRSHRSKDNVGGSGIGLYLSKAIVDQHRGKIWAQSVEGQGSTFGFSLPPLKEAQQLLDTSNQVPGDRGHHGWIKNHSLYRR